MTGLDTNVLVRYLAQDDEEQLRAVLAMLLKKIPPSSCLTSCW
jgi:predicted nucleic-acid-binding protein